MKEMISLLSVLMISEEEAGNGIVFKSEPDRAKYGECMTKLAPSPVVFLVHHLRF